jgi:hypothetical protein
VEANLILAPALRKSLRTAIGQEIPLTHIQTTRIWEADAHSAQVNARTVTEIGIAGEGLEGEDLDELIGFWSAGELRPPYFVRPCRKRFDLYHLNDTPSEVVWHQETVMAQADFSSGTPTTQEPLPEPGRKKKSPRELEKILDQGIEDSMAASDPPAAAQPEVHKEPDRDDPPSKDDHGK